MFLVVVVFTYRCLLWSLRTTKSRCYEPWDIAIFREIMISGTPSGSLYRVLVT